jgi:hypothetical protein
MSKSAAIWEYARSFARGKLTRLELTRELRWLFALSSQLPASKFLSAPWIEVFPSYKDWIMSQLDALPPAYKIEAPQIACAAARILSCDTPDRLTIEIDLLADDAATREQVIAMIPMAKKARHLFLPLDAPSEPAAGRGQGRADKWCAALSALGTWRLRHAGWLYSQIARLRLSRCWAGSLISLERSAKRDMSLVSVTCSTLLGSKAL